VKIGFGTCRDPSLIAIYVTLGEETYIMVLIEGVFDAFKECKVFILMPTAKYLRLDVGMKVLWSLKDLSMENLLTTPELEQCYTTMDVCNNLGKKWVFNHDKDLCKVLLENVVEVEDLGDMWDGFHNKEIHLEMCYTSDDHAKCSIEGFGSNFDNDEWNEKEIETRYDDIKTTKF